MKPIAIASLLLAASPLAYSEPKEPIRDLGLSNVVTTRLAQIDVTVSGPDAAVAALRDQDFEVWVEGKQVERFIVDRTCSGASSNDEPAPELAKSERAFVAVPPPIAPTPAAPATETTSPAPPPS